MGKNQYKVALALILALLILSLLWAWRENQERANSLLIHVIDVGQGDCMVLETQEGNVMIDTGTNISESALRGYLRSHGLTEFSYMILSHPHDDHIGNADMILEEFTVERVLCAESSSTEQVWQDFLSALNTANTSWVKPLSGTVCWVGRLRIEVLMIPNEENQGGNNDSLIVRVDYGDCSMLFTGDAEKGEEERLLETVPSEHLSVDLLKVAHHGSSGSSTEAFLNAAMPKIAVISAGEGNSFCHPHEELLNRLRTLNVEIYRTDIHGSLIFTCNGETISLQKRF